MEMTGLLQSTDNPNYAGVIRDSAGNLYSVADEGGIGAGTIFKLDRAGKLTVLHTFGDNAGGSNPVGELVRDGAGNLYGTALLGGSAGGGLVFKVAPLRQYETGRKHGLAIPHVLKIAMCSNPGSRRPIRDEDICLVWRFGIAIRRPHQLFAIAA